MDLSRSLRNFDIFYPYYNRSFDNIFCNDRQKDFKIDMKENDNRYSILADIQVLVDLILKYLLIMIC